MFSLADYNKSGTLDANEFCKVFNDYRLDVSAEELKSLFNSFDINQDGNIDFNEFLRQVVGELNDFRRGYVMQAF